MKICNCVVKLPFGDDLSTPQRTIQLGYAADNTRQRFTGYEKDQESDLEFAQARYYNHNHGRFTSVDPTMASADTINPQTFNRYSYVLNSPYNLTDPSGLSAQSSGGCSAENASCADENGQSSAESEYQQRLQNTQDVVSAKKAITGGDFEAAKTICASNSALTCSGLNIADSSDSPLEYGRTVGKGYRKSIEELYIDLPTFVLFRRGVSSDFYNSVIEYSPQNVGQDPQDEPYYGRYSTVSGGTDQAGHIQAKALGGGGDKYNLTSQRGSVNNSPIKKFENTLRRILTIPFRALNM